MLEGIVPIVFTPFDENGDIDAHGLRRILRFEAGRRRAWNRHQWIRQRSL